MTFERITELPEIPKRPEEGHKGTFGRAVIVAGSRGMSGAAILAGLGALRGGAGLVYIALPKEIGPVVASYEPSYLTIPLPHDDVGCLNSESVKLLDEAMSKSDAVAIGPGCGLSTELESLVTRYYRELDKPLVIDADGLNNLAAKPGLPAEHEGPRILTPHPGEFARLTNATVAEGDNERETQAADFAEQHALVLVLKGHRTIVTDGRRLYRNTTGNSGMATGGSGDVLTGLITALLAQGMAPFSAAQLGVLLHGLAGDLAASQCSQQGMIASDLPRFLCEAWQAHATATNTEPF